MFKKIATLIVALALLAGCSSLDPGLVNSMNEYYKFSKPIIEDYVQVKDGLSESQIKAILTTVKAQGLNVAAALKNIGG